MYNVLFVCTRNSARSILAECLIREVSNGTVRAFSAGSFPTDEVHPYALQLLREQGLPTAGLHSKSWNEFAAPNALMLDFVFTVCDRAANEVPPVWPGHPVAANWLIPDPAEADGSEADRMRAFRDAFRMLERRVKLFLALPLASLDRRATRFMLDAIGRLGPEHRKAG
jgi:arsenate reductase (thioredoxin)